MGLTLLAVALGSGCLQLEYEIRLHEEDGGATVIERIGLTAELLELDARTPEAQKLGNHLKKEAVLKRMAGMGQGVALKDHQVKSNPDGSMSSEAIFEIANVGNLRLPNPFMREALPRYPMHLGIGPVASRLGSRVQLTGHVGEKARGPTAAPGGTPLDIQAYRDLGPMVADLLRGLRVAVYVTIPTGFTGGFVRGANVGAKRMDLFMLSENNLDLGGTPFLQNEEAMLALLRFDPFSWSIRNHTKEYVANWSVPVIREHAVGYGHAAQMMPTAHMTRTWFAPKPKAEPKK